MGAAAAFATGVADEEGRRSHAAQPAPAASVVRSVGRTIRRTGRGPSGRRFAAVAQRHADDQRGERRRAHAPARAEHAQHEHGRRPCRERAEHDRERDVVRVRVVDELLAERDDRDERRAERREPEVVDSRGAPGLRRLAHSSRPRRRSGWPRGSDHTARTYGEVPAGSANRPIASSVADRAGSGDPAIG
jgi:hypothetical protein